MSLITFVALLAFVQSATAFIGHNAARSMVKISSLSMKAEFPKALFGLAPALIASPAFASVDAITTTMPLSLEVTFAAYLAILLGTFIPVTFLIVLYSQSEARKAGLREGKSGK